MSAIKKHAVLNILAKSEQNRLFTSVFLQSFATSLIGIFVPIYLLKHGFNLHLIILFYVLHYTSCLLFASLGMFINHHLGIKKSMAIGMLLSLSGYYALSGIHGFNTAAVVSCLLLAAGGTIYHLGYHIELTRSLKFHREGQALSTLYICALSANLSGPLLGALLIAGLSFSGLIGVVGVMLLLALIPLFMSADYKLPIQTYDPFKIFKAGETRQSIIFSAQGVIKTAQDTFWPIFIFGILKNVVSLGFVSSLSAFVVMMATYMIGKMVDKDNARSLRWGVVTHIGSWNLKLALLTPFGIFFTNFLGSLSSSLIDNSFNKVVYGGAKHSTTQSTYFLYREYTMLLGRIAILLLLLIAPSLTLLFITTALLGATLLLATRDMGSQARVTQQV